MNTLEKRIERLEAMAASEHVFKVQIRFVRNEEEVNAAESASHARFISSRPTPGVRDEFEWVD